MTAIRKITGINNLTKFEKICSQNSLKMRGFIADYIKKRKSGERKSKVDEGVDLLSLFLSNTDVFTEELVIDEIIDFFAAATLTTQFALQTIMMQCAKNPSVLKKLREEFD